MPTLNHVHSLDTNNRCTIDGCTYVFTVPPICFSLEISDGPVTRVNEGFNTSDLSYVIMKLRLIADELERGER